MHREGAFISQTVTTKHEYTVRRLDSPPSVRQNHWPKQVWCGFVRAESCPTEPIGDRRMWRGRHNPGSARWDATI